MAERRVAVVTGSNKGIGFAIVKALCKDFDGIVYLTSRDENRGLKAVEELKSMGLSPLFHQLDIDDEASVLKLRDHLLKEHGGLDVLVNNAAIIFRMTCTEPFGDTVERTIRTNFFHTLRLNDILFPILRPHARVVNLTSDDGHLLKIAGKEPEASQLRARFAAPDLTIEQLSDLMNEFIECAKRGDYFEKGWPSSWEVREDDWPNDGYIVSKVGISAMTRIHQKQFDKDPRNGMTVNCVHPGYVTDATNQKGDLTADEGAVAASWLAMLPADAEGPKGAYIWRDKQVVDWVNGPTPTIY